MNTDDIIRALQPYTDGTHVVVRLTLSDGGLIEFAIKRIDYTPTDSEGDAYLAVVPDQG